MLQEIKVPKVDDAWAYSFWGNREVEWSARGVRVDQEASQFYGK